MEKHDVVDDFRDELPHQVEEKSPILGSWRNVYLLVVLVLVLVIAGLWLLTKTFR